MKKIEICMGSACFAKGNQENLEFIRNYTQNNNIEIEITGALCKNECLSGPRIIIDGVEHKNVTKEKIEELLKKG